MNKGAKLALIGFAMGVGSVILTKYPDKEAPQYECVESIQHYRYEVDRIRENLVMSGMYEYLGSIENKLEELPESPLFYKEQCVPFFYSRSEHLGSKDVLEQAVSTARELAISDHDRRKSLVHYQLKLADDVLGTLDDKYNSVYPYKLPGLLGVSTSIVLLALGGSMMVRDESKPQVSRPVKKKPINPFIDVEGYK